MARTSIIIPTHNRAVTLRRAIESAKNAGRDIEVIVVDDASTDETPTMYRDFPGITYIRLDRNAGPSCARNAGIAASGGGFVGFLDDDDWLIAGSLDRQADILNQNSAWGFVYGQVDLGDSDSCAPTGDLRPLRCPTGDLFWELLRGNFICTGSVLVRRQSLERVGLFDPTLRFLEDWDLWLRLAEAYAVGALEEAVAVCRTPAAGSNRLSANRPKMFRSAMRALDKALTLPRAQELDLNSRIMLRSDFLDSIWNELVREANYALSSGRYGYAAINYVTAIQLNPKRGLRPTAGMSFLRDLTRAKATSK